MGRIADCFAALRQRGEAALVPYLMAGDPDLDATRAVIHAAVFASENWSVDSKKMTAIHSPTGPQAASTPLSGMRSATAPAGADASSFPTALTPPASR